MKLQCNNNVLQEEYHSLCDSFQLSKAKAQVPACKENQFSLDWSTTKY